MYSSHYYEDVSPEIEISKRQFKLLSPKQMIRRLLIVLAQDKADNTSKKLLSEIQQTIHSLYWVK